MGFFLKYKNILRCPRCFSPKLKETDETLTCKKCQTSYKWIDNSLCFENLKEGKVEDLLDKVKYKLKRFDRFYKFLDWLISPVFFDGHLRRFVRRQVEPLNGIAINLGSGTTNISPKMLNVDMFNYHHVDLVCDIDNLPFQNQTVDLVINFHVLEHVRDPEKVVSEIYRILKPGGVIYTAFPFMQGFHASPHDYSRRTYHGIQVLHRDFELKEVGCVAGPTSGMLWAVQEWLAILLSFGNRYLHLSVYLLLMVTTFPIKFFDIFLNKSPFAKNLASSFFYIGKKPEGKDSTR